MGVVLVEVDATVGKLSEGSLLLDFGSRLGVLFEGDPSAFVCHWGCADESGSADTHVFVGHDCGSLTGVRFSMLVERRMWSKSW